MSDDPTLPPNAPNTPRTWLRRAWAWCKGHPDYAIPAATFVLGALLGRLL